MLNLVRKDERIVKEIQGAKFFIRRPSWAESQRVNETLASMEQDEGDPFKNIKPMLRCYLVGWEGVGEDGEEVEFSPDKIDMLPYDVAFELAMECRIIRQADGSKKKKRSRS